MVATISASNNNHLSEIKVLLITFLLIEFTIPFYETGYTQLNQNQIFECIESIESNICRQIYLETLP